MPVENLEVVIRIPQIAKKDLPALGSLDSSTPLSSYLPIMAIKDLK